MRISDINVISLCRISYYYNDLDFKKLHMFGGFAKGFFFCIQDMTNSVKPQLPAIVFSLTAA